MVFSIKNFIKVAFLLFLIIFDCFSFVLNNIFYTPLEHYKKKLDDEIRAVWIATVLNLDWPKATESEDQKKELIEILDFLKEKKINRAYLQVRCRGDALYLSEQWPWSCWLTGELGTDPGYDPLLMFRDGCFQRGITPEAWINPFYIGSRTKFDIKKYFEKLPENNPLKYHPEWIIVSSNGWHMLNPGIPEVRKLIIQEVIYIAKKYQISIHMDDYFYPYPNKKNQDINLDDQAEYKLYGKRLSLEDFRRNNINKFIEALYTEIKKLDSELTLSISPFAIWKNSAKDGGCGTQGLESYHKIFCDSVFWVKRNFIDYIIPQIYWHIGFEIADYEALAKWWNDVVNGSKVKLIIGQAGYRLNKNSIYESFRNSGEIINQIKLNRKLSNVCGQSIFSLSCLRENCLGIRDKLEEIYK
ncbi:MAG: family 10 glycosylhydrolase [Oscillospiraceae bacterium]|jgi:uncharacterized lipoprotein YddW (UPF0748 family)|nr:family 10 glycosylhydrolase [Oscillospiraceae bacterium]